MHVNPNVTCSLNLVPAQDSLAGRNPVNTPVTVNISYNAPCCYINQSRNYVCIFSGWLANHPKIMSAPFGLKKYVLYIYVHVWSTVWPCYFPSNLLIPTDFLLETLWLLLISSWIPFIPVDFLLMSIHLFLCGFFMLFFKKYFVCCFCFFFHVFLFFFGCVCLCFVQLFFDLFFLHLVFAIFWLLCKSG